MSGEEKLPKSYIPTDFSQVSKHATKAAGNKLNQSLGYSYKKVGYILKGKR